MSKNLVGQYAPSPHSPIVQRMTEAEHNQVIPKHFSSPVTKFEKIFHLEFDVTE